MTMDERVVLSTEFSDQPILIVDVATVNLGPGTLGDGIDLARLGGDGANRLIVWARCVTGKGGKRAGGVRRNSVTDGAGGRAWHREGGGGTFEHGSGSPYGSGGRLWRCSR